MIERLLAADRALEAGDLDGARRLFDQVAGADPRNAIAIVGQAEVARRRGDPGEARRLATAALTIDPAEAAAQRLVKELDAGPGELVGDATAPAVIALAPVGTRRPAARGGVLGWLRRLFGRGG
jgi:hypothetical protein